MAKLKKITALAASALAAGAMPVLSFAQITTVQHPPSQEGFRFETILRIFATLISWIFTILLVIATLLIFYAAFLYLTAAGDTEKTKKAQQTLIYAAVGIAVALLAQGVQFLVKQLVL